ncbi:MAG TPA: CAP domain-containing protein [Nocardioidaceae bacterium]|nr:CAP domain-containing protein [Nocardioidaceae bacterium]
MRACLGIGRACIGLATGLLLAVPIPPTPDRGRWSEHLAASGDFEHQNLNVIFRRCDGARSAGENIARGGVSPRATVRLWMNSPGHRANILNRRYTHLGVGAAARNGQWTGAEDFARIRR